MDDGLRGTILRAYDTVADASLWPSVLDEFSDRIGALGCIVFERRDPERRMAMPFHTSNYDSASLLTYTEKFHREEWRDQEIFESQSLKHDGIDLVDDSVLAENVEDLKKRPNVEVLQKFGILHRAAGLLNKDNKALSRFSIQLGLDRGRPTDEERAIMTAVLPHFAKAMDLGRPAQELALTHQALLAAMDRLVVGVCILTQDGLVAAQNIEFARQLDMHPTFRIEPDGRLTLRSSTHQQRLSELMSDASAHGHFGARPRKEAIETNDGSFLCLEVTPLESSDEMGTETFGGYVLFSTDTGRPLQFDAAPLKDAYGLTQAEMLVVEGVSEGLTNAQIAERRERSVETVNAQVKTVLSKTQCATRTQLVRMLLSFGGHRISKEN